EELANFAVAESLNRWNPDRGRLTTVVPWAVRSNFNRQRADLLGAVEVPVYYASGQAEEYKYAKQGLAVFQRRSLEATRPGSRSGSTFGSLLPDEKRDGRNM